MSLDDDDPKVKLIDFGAATWDKDDHRSGGLKLLVYETLSYQCMSP